MKKLSYILIICFSFNTIPSFAQMELMDLPDAFNQLDFEQNISDEDFNKTIDSIKENTKKGKKEKKQLEKQNKKRPKLDGDILNTPFEFVKLENTLLTLPFNIKQGEITINKGFYKVKKYKIKNTYFIELQQGYNKIRLPMTKTQEEFEDDNLTFVKTKQYENYLKIIFVDMDDTLVNYFKIK